MIHDIDKDPEVKKDMEELDALAESIANSAKNCEMSDIFLDNIGLIGGLHRKYTKFTYLPNTSDSAKKFDNSIRKAKNAKLEFVKTCRCIPNK